MRFVRSLSVKRPQQGRVQNQIKEQGKEDSDSREDAEPLQWEHARRQKNREARDQDYAGAHDGSAGMEIRMINGRVHVSVDLVVFPVLMEERMVSSTAMPIMIEAVMRLAMSMGMCTKPMKPMTTTCVW
jgi:hypothetical protein